MYKAIKTDATTLIPEIVDIGFEVRYSESLESDWIYVTRGGVTGYESAEVRKLIESYLERSVFATWTACMGTLNKYHRLEIPMSEIVRYLEDQDLIEVTRKYGYVKEITWKDNN